MGYSYQGGRLCCDVCGTAGARKVRCPAGYCQAIAQCPTCRKDPTVQARILASHKDCGRLHAEFVAKEARAAALLQAGAHLRCAALGGTDPHGGERVHVIFRGKADELGYYMAPEVYHAIPLLEPATPDDYRKHGALTPAPTDFHFKEIAA